MKLLSIELHNILGAPDGAYSFTDAHGAPLGVALITGGPASGKTSLLEAIVAAKEAVGPYGGARLGKHLLRRGATAGRISATWLLSEQERERESLGALRHTVVWEVGDGAPRIEVDPRLRRLFSEHHTDPSRGKVEYFPARRQIDPGALAAEQGGFAPIAHARLRLTRDPVKYTALLPTVRALALRAASEIQREVSERGLVIRSREQAPLAPLAAAVAAMTPDLRLADVDLGDARDGVRFLRRDRTMLTLADLSESEKQGVLFALAFSQLGLSRSLVLIDEPELHIHASDRARFLHALVALGTDNQILAATGSSDLTAVATPTQVLDLSARRRREVVG